MATAYLKQNFSCIFQQLDDTVSKNTIGTSSRKTKQSYVIKHSTVEDISQLPSETNYNKPKKCKTQPEATATNPHRKLNKVAVRPTKGQLVVRYSLSIYMGIWIPT
jgi:hypothetical protein